MSGLLPEERDAYALRAIEESLDTLAPLGDDLAQLLREQASTLSSLLVSALGFYDAVWPRARYCSTSRRVSCMNAPPFPNVSFSLPAAKYTPL